VVKVLVEKGWTPIPYILLNHYIKKITPSFNKYKITKMQMKIKVFKSSKKTNTEMKNSLYKQSHDAILDISQ
jgi:hypothetical protein